MSESQSEALSSSLRLATIKYKLAMEYTKEGKVLHATKSSTIRELVDKANRLKIQKEDIVSILQANNSYVLLYYYQGINE